MLESAFTTRVDQTNGSTLVKLILFEKSRVELEFVFSIFTTRVRKHFGNSGSIGAYRLTPRGVFSVGFRTGRSRGNLAMTPDVAVVIPLK